MRMEWLLASLLAVSVPSYAQNADPEWDAESRSLIRSLSLCLDHQAKAERFHPDDPTASPKMLIACQDQSDAWSRDCLRTKIPDVCDVSHQLLLAEAILVSQRP